MNKKIRVLVVEDSNVVRQLLEYIIGRDPRLEMAGAVASAEEALRVLHRLSPDVISMDIRLPGMNGFEATRRIMSEKPTPIVVIASVEFDELKITLKALQAGALSVLEKPVSPTSEKYEAVAEKICTQLLIMSQVRLVGRRGSVIQTPHRTKQQLSAPLGPFQMMGIVCSTGGPSALAQLLGSGLGSDFPLPILLVQHINSNFLSGFASWLQSVCPFSVKIVSKRETPVPGTVYLACPDRHLQLNSGCLEATPGNPVCMQRPSGTVLFDSMAVALGSQTLGVLLTGMGEDGAEGLLTIRESGGHTIAEDESTAVVYGMPGEAIRLGAVCESLPLPAIGPRLLSLAARKASST